MSQAAKASTTAAANPGPDGKGRGAPPTGPPPASGPAQAPASAPAPTAKAGDVPPGSYRVRTWAWRGRAPPSAFSALSPPRCPPLTRPRGCLRGPERQSDREG